MADDTTIGPTPDDPQRHRTLVERLADGDELALEELVVEHRPQIEAFARRRARPLGLQEASLADVVQLACMEALRRVRDGFEYHSRAQFVSWLFRITASRLIDWRRAKQVHDVGRDDASVGELAATLCSPSDFAIGNEARERLSAAIDGLPEEHRDMIFLRKVLGLSYAEIAEQMGRSEPACRKLLARALAKLSLSQGS